MCFRGFHEPDAKQESDLGTADAPIGACVLAAVRCRASGFSGAYHTSLSFPGEKARQMSILVSLKGGNL